MTRALSWALVAAAAWQAIPLAAPAAAADVRPPDDRPPAAITLPCQVIEVYDGDTLTVRVSVDLRVRLLGCWAPEVRTRDDAEKRAGLASRDHLRTLAEGAPVLVSVPLGHADRLDDLLSMGRVLASVWRVGDATSLAAQQVAAGHATRERPKPAGPIREPTE